MKNYLSHPISICKLNVCQYKVREMTEVMDDLHGSGRSKKGQFEKLFVWVTHD